MSEVKITEPVVKTLAQVADLPLDETRYKLIAPELEIWINAANKLNEKMSAEEHLTVQPITVFSHPEKYIQKEK
jgi:hypothetical protein